MEFRKTKYIISILLLIFANNIFAQNDSILDNYIKVALQNNLALKQKTETYNNSLVKLKEAKSMFFPKISLNARYSIAEGGRTIDIPVGDMINPVYNNLNEINDFMYSAGLIDKPEKYPNIENESINFLRKHEHETKARLVQPIINNQIWYNNKIKKNQSDIEKENYNKYKNELISEVTNAYYKYIQTVELLKIIDESKKLVNENINFNKKLFKNNKVTYDNVLRAKTEFVKLEQKEIEYNKLNTTSKAYFNFLLNKNFKSEISISSNTLKKENEFKIENLIDSALKNRNELKILNLYKTINKNNTKLNKTNALPNIYGVIDYGFQGENYNFDKNHDFYIASIVLKWDLFKGFENKNKIQESKINQKIIDYKFEETQKKINLEVLNLYYELKSAEKNLDLAKSEQDLSKENFKIVNKKYEIGSANLLEYYDAKTQYTNSQINYTIKKYDYLIKLSELKKGVNYNKN